MLPFYFPSKYPETSIYSMPHKILTGGGDQVLLYSSLAAPAYIHNCPDLMYVKRPRPTYTIANYLCTWNLICFCAWPAQGGPSTAYCRGGECTSSIWPSAAPSTHPPRHPTPPHQPRPAQPPAPYPTAPHTTPSTAPSAAPKASFKIPAQKKFRGADNKNGTRVQWLRSPWEDGPPPRRPRGSY